MVDSSRLGADSPKQAAWSIIKRAKKGYYRGSAEGWNVQKGLKMSVVYFYCSISSRCPCCRYMSFMDFTYESSPGQRWRCVSHPWLQHAWHCLSYWTSEAPSWLSRSSAIPLYLLIQSNTSLCQTLEFSGFSTHCPLLAPQLYFRVIYTYMVLIRECEEARRDVPQLEDIEGC